MIIFLRNHPGLHRRQSCCEVLVLINAKAQRREDAVGGVDFGGTPKSACETQALPETKRPSLGRR
jgi:hypothetical protein